MKLQDVLSKGIDILAPSKQQPYWVAVYTDATQITRRYLDSEEYPLLNTVRPSEDDEIKNYRKANFTNIARGDFNAALTNIRRVNQATTISFQSTESPAYEYLNSDNFRIDGQSIDFVSWLYDFLLRESADDPNGAIVVKPVNPLNPEVAPAELIENGGLPSTERVKPSVEWVPSALIRYRSDSVLVYIGGETTFKHNGRNQTSFYYYAIDEDGWHLIMPYSSDKKISYRATLWYSVELGQKPLIPTPSDIAKTPNNEYYRESYFDGFFKLAKDVLNAYDDNKAVRVRFNYPKIGMANLPCPNCKGSGKVYDEVNKGYITCDSSSCNDGIIKDPGPYHTLVAPDGGMMGEQKGKLLEYYSPDTSIMQHSFEVPFMLRAHMREVLALDLLTDAGANSSDLALERRERYAYNLYSKISNGLYDAADYILKQIALLLSSEDCPYINRPSNYDIKSLTKLKEEANSSPFENRFNKKMKAYSIEYKNDPVTLRKLEIMMTLYPVTILNDNEVKNMLAKGALTSDDCKRGMYAMPALNSISEVVDITTAKIAEIVKLLDLYFLEMGIIVPDETIDIFEGSEVQ